MVTTRRLGTITPMQDDPFKFLNSVAIQSILKSTILLRAADRYAYSDCGSTAYSVGTVYGRKGHLYTPGVCPGLLATPCLASLAINLHFTGDHLDDARRPTGDALLD
jgi:hypothetical protein